MNYPYMVQVTLATMLCLGILLCVAVFLPDRFWDRGVYNMFLNAVGIVFALFFIGIGISCQGVVR